MTTTASSWETLTADFTNLIDPNVDYNRVTVIFDFVVDQPGDSTTYYYDNIQVADVSGGGGDPVTLPVDFEDPDLNYRFEGFEGAISQIIMNPDPTGENTSSMVMETLKGQGSQPSLPVPLSIWTLPLISQRVRAFRSVAGRLRPISPFGFRSKPEKVSPLRP
jgi:hypothetical protein